MTNPKIYEAAYQRIDGQKLSQRRPSTSYALVPGDNIFSDYLKMVDHLVDVFFSVDKDGESPLYDKLYLLRVNYPSIIGMSLERIKMEARGLTHLVATKTIEGVVVLGAIVENDDILKIRNHFDTCVRLKLSEAQTENFLKH